MLKISPAMIGAFERSLAKDDLQTFTNWWRCWEACLGRLDSSSLAKLLVEARLRGGSLGIEDNDRNRLFLLAAAIRFFPQPDDRQYLLLADAIFDSESDEACLAVFSTLAQSG